jgi:SAM-dependent methyltransferase
LSERQSDFVGELMGNDVTMQSQTITPYNDTFFDLQVDNSLAAARAVLPIVLQLLPATSAVDFGCGRGTWLKACLENGVETVLGLDGDYVALDKLLINPNLFRTVDLKQSVRLDRTFDLALCVEVAEHLPEKSARPLVESLAAAAPTVLFSAALPGQGGTSHVNEQWPAYWERLFAEQGMRKHDVLRPLIWHDRSIERWYRQNLYLFATNEMTVFDCMAHFEPDFVFALNRIIKSATFDRSTTPLNYPRLVRRIRSILSRFG